MADFMAMLRRENLRLDPKQFGQVKLHSAIRRARDGSIDRKERFLELPGLAQAFRQGTDEARDQDVVLLSAQFLARSVANRDLLPARRGRLQVRLSARCHEQGRCNRISSGVYDQLLDEIAGARQIAGP